MVKPLELMKGIAEKLDVPYAVNYYKGSAKEFAVYSIKSVSGELYCDNRAQEHVAAAAFDYIQPINKAFQDKMFEISDLLIAAGFTEPQITIVNDSNTYTILQFRCEIKL